jgi:hypothetical protein
MNHNRSPAALADSRLPFCPFRLFLLILTEGLVAAAPRRDYLRSSVFIRRSHYTPGSKRSDCDSSFIPHPSFLILYPLSLAD